MTRGVLKAKKAKETKARKEKEKTKKGKLEPKFKELQKSIKNRKATGLGGAYAARTKKLEKERDTLKLQLDALNRPKTDKKDFSDFGSSGSSPKTKKSAGYSPRAGKLRKSSGSVTPINTSPSKPKTETPKAGPAELGSQRSTKEKDTTIDKSAGRDSREDGIGVKIARALGDKRSVDKMISDRKESEAMEEEMNLRKGGAVAKKYGMREGGFTKRGGMYKKGY